ncbi:acetyl/propionyl/methylcrotonyl-CoA carboxylase subunit alpha [Arthrobacter russicus]|jgi:propionyl-CoA carboxylase alpha chain|nr:biotin carboxylase N-terminal domain-containing protein [Arthrobacter russicus]
MTTSPITSVLVANRGEIARRVFHTCKEQGIRTVAVYSTPDADAPFVREADVAVHLPGASAALTYLRADLVIEAALKAGVDAIHPGYGFLSENGDFAQAVEDAGLTWIGPSAEAIYAMGSKIESKRLVAAAGVPILAEMDPNTVAEAQLPVLIKASAGGGGRGMRIVRSVEALPAELELARAEAASAFGDSTVFCEPYLETGHHVEVQIMADRHGTVHAVGERECSIQRRHQKVVEEAPSPLVERTPGMRARLFEAAILAAKAVDYAGAGTVEFLADEQGRFFFLEMNTRLQVEHPVTECTTGLDLVAMQLHVAEGGELPAELPAAHGSSIEVRIYAEDPAADWQPQAGTLQSFEFDGLQPAFAVPARDRGVRCDSAVESGSVVSVNYDPMLAKLISWAPRRAVAARVLANALSSARLHGVRTNRDLLVRILQHPSFIAGHTDTAFLTSFGLAELSAPLLDAETERIAALAASLAAAAKRREAARVLGGLPSGWRNLPSASQTCLLKGPRAEHQISYRWSRNGVVAPGFDNVEVRSASANRVTLAVDGITSSWAVSHYLTTSGSNIVVDTQSGSASFEVIDPLPDPSAARVSAGSLIAPMPGAIAAIQVDVGDLVTEGQALIVLEAMKMLHTIVAPASGVVTELPARLGVNVDVGTVLIVVAENDSAPVAEDQKTSEEIEEKV